MLGAEVTHNNQWLRDEPQVSVGGLLEWEIYLWKLRSLKERSQDLRQSCGADRARRGYHSTKTEDQKVFYPIL